MFGAIAGGIASALAGGAMSKLFGGGQKAASKQFRHGATSKSRSNTASNSTKHKSPHLSGWRQIISLIDRKSGSAGMPRPISYAVFCLKKKKKKQEDIENT